MPEQSTYGEQFLKHLTTIGKQTPYPYKDLQEIKAMNREQLAERLKTECPQIAEMIMSKSATEVAEIVQEKKMEWVVALSHLAEVKANVSFFESVIQLFRATV